jgi:hypothetical protein
MTGSFFMGQGSLSSSSFKILELSNQRLLGLLTGRGDGFIVPLF